MPASSSTPPTLSSVVLPSPTAIKTIHSDVSTAHSAHSIRWSVRAAPGRGELRSVYAMNSRTAGPASSASRWFPIDNAAI